MYVYIFVYIFAYNIKYIYGDFHSVVQTNFQPSPQQELCPEDAQQHCDWGTSINPIFGSTPFSVCTKEYGSSSLKKAGWCKKRGPRLWTSHAYAEKWATQECSGAAHSCRIKPRNPDGLWEKVYSFLPLSGESKLQSRLPLFSVGSFCMIIAARLKMT